MDEAALKILSSSNGVGIREVPKKTHFLGKFSQIWVGGVADSQTGTKPPKSPRKSPFLP